MTPILYIPDADPALSPGTLLKAASVEGGGIKAEPDSKQSESNE